MIRIRVIGTPGPQGSKRHVGGGIMVESSKKVAPWREDVANAAEKQVAREDRGIDGPLSVGMVFILRAPGSASKKRLAMGPIAPPDISKLVRSTEDALTTSGVWKDDARVVNYHKLTKRYAADGEATGAEIEITEYQP